MATDETGGGKVDPETTQGTKDHPVQGGNTAAEPRHLEALTPKELVDDVIKNPAKAVNIEEARENVRGFLAKWLLITLGGTLLAGFLLIATQRFTLVSAPDVKSFFEIVFSPLVTLISAATGFYFGSSQQQKDSDD